MSMLSILKSLVISTDGINPSATPSINFDGSNAIAAARFSVPMLCKFHDTIGLQVSSPAGSTFVGSYSIQGSNDQSQLEDNGNPDVNLTNWATLSMWDEASGAWVQSKALASGQQSFISTVQILSCRWVRLNLAFTSGTGLLKAQMQVKSDSGR